MARLLLCMAIVAPAIFFASCAMLRPTPQQRAARMGPMLAAAGFREYPADTPAKRKALEGLPALKLKRYVNKEGEARYWVADPYKCGCLYEGGPEAYQDYQRLRLQNRMVREQQEAAQENLEASQNWMMSPFGFGPFGPYVGTGVGFGFGY